MDFDFTPYAEVRDALMRSGIMCGIMRRHQITVSVQDGAIWPDRGNSFWITHATGCWHLFTWAPVGYRIPDGTDMAQLCVRSMASGDRAMFRLPDEIRDEFGLTELSAADVQSVFNAMETVE